MLAVTHHFLVQLAARRAGVIRPGVWFTNYELLGDDINIFDQEVAMQYLKIMNDIGVPINLSKSVVAKTAAFEFAKVTGFGRFNVSAISWKMFMSQSSMMGRVNIVFSLLKKDIIKDRPISWIKRIIRKSQFVTGDYSFSFVALMAMYVSSGELRFEDLIKSLMS